MKLDFLPSACDGRPMVRLYEYDAGDLSRLLAVCLALADDNVAVVNLHGQRWIEPAEGVRFSWTQNDADPGLSSAPGDTTFRLELSAQGWREVHDKIFALSTGDGFQWLANDNGIDLLISQTGQW